LPNTTTVARLRRALAAYFDEPVVYTALRYARIAGQIPAGTAGRNGCGSAPVTVRQALLIPLALASDAHPMNGPAEAERIGSFRLLRRDRTHVSEPEQRIPYENQQISLLDVMVSEVERFDPPDRVPSCWDISSNGACQAAPDRLVFGPSLEALSDPSDCVVRSCTIPSRLLGEIAALFAAAARAEAA
jgi:hypothetical protein